MLTEKKLRSQCMQAVPATARLFTTPLFATHDPVEQAALASNLARCLEAAAQETFGDEDHVRVSRHHIGAQFAALFAAALRGEHDVCSICTRALPAQAQSVVPLLFAANDPAGQAAVASDLARRLEAAGDEAARCGHLAKAMFCRVGAQFAALFADALRADVPACRGCSA